MAKRTKQNKNTARQSKAPARVPTVSVTQGTALRAALFGSYPCPSRSGPSKIRGISD